MKGKLVSLLICLFSVVAYGVENLEPQDFFGQWVSDRELASGETQMLLIRENHTSVFSRELKATSNQVFQLDQHNFDFRGDLVILDFGVANRSFSYKLVLSGWKAGGSKKLYGMMFLYRNGIQFNGIPVSFEPKSDEGPE